MISFVYIADDTLVNCTACGKQVNQFQRNSVYEHPALKVLICKVRKFHICIANIFIAFTAKVHVIFIIFIVVVFVSHIIIYFSPSHATNITQVMTSAETRMEWMSSAGMKLYAVLLTYSDMNIHNRSISKHKNITPINTKCVLIIWN